MSLRSVNVVTIYSLCTGLHISVN